MKLLIYSANLGSFDSPKDHEEQELPKGIDLIEYWRCTDEDFPTRFNAMTPRLQARIVKMFGWQMKPDYYFYLWVDSSCRLSKPDSVWWFLEQLGGNDIAFFRHNKRSTIQEEADYLKERLKIELDKPEKDRYVTSRYKNEDIDGALSEADPQAPLYASTAFIYRSSPKVQKALKQWWYLTSRYHSIDQLGLSEAIKDLYRTDINMDYLKCEYLEYTR